MKRGYIHKKFKNQFMDREDMNLVIDLLRLGKVTVKILEARQFHDGKGNFTILKFTDI